MTLQTNVHLLTLDEVAGKIKFSPATVKRWTLKKLSGWPQPRRVGPQGELRWIASEIDRWVLRQPAGSRRTR